MKNKILQITLNNPISFEEILNQLKSDTEISKPDLSFILKTLSSENKLLEIDKKFHNLESYPSMRGYVHASINNLAWIAPDDSTNDFGIAFSRNDNLTLLFNKKDIPLKSLVEYKEIPLDSERKMAYATDIVEAFPTYLIVAKKHRNWVILNTQYNLEIYDEQIAKHPIASDPSTIKDDIFLLKYDNNEFNFIEKIGNISDPGIESLITEKLVGIPLPPDVNLEQIQSKNSTAPILDIPFITIDAKTTTDVDDAISIKKINDNEFILYVAIADVDNHVPINSGIDLHAQKVATTFYLTSKKIPMFAPTLSEDLCSLNLGETRNAMICEIHIKDNDVSKYSFYQSKIKVKYKITYDDVDKILNNESPTESFYLTSMGLIDKLNSIESIPQEGKSLLLNFQDFALKNKKIQPEKNYWFVPTPEFELNENKKIDHLFLKNEETNSISQSIVETSMLKANICAAKFLKNTYPYIGIFRNQIAPENTDKPKTALYESATEGHWGLSEDTYTHFTSPIRRYCDLIAHRLIKAAINNSPAPYTSDEIDKITDNLNQQQYIAKQCYIKEKSILLGEYLSDLIKEQKLSNKYALFDYNEKGILLRNKQHVEVFLPYFKVDRNIKDYLLQNICEDKTKQIHIDSINEKWQIKCFIDYFEWHQDRKTIETKFYPKTFDHAQNPKI